MERKRSGLEITVQLIEVEPLYKHILRYPLLKYKSWRDTAKEQQKYGPPYTENELLQQAFFDELRCKKTIPLSIHECLKSKIDPNVKNKQDSNNRPLHYAARNGHIILAKMLLQAKANVNLPNDLGVTPLMVAAGGTQPKHADFVRFLIANGSDVNFKDRGGNTALIPAISSSNVSAVSALLGHGAADHIQSSDAMFLAKKIRARKNDVDFLQSDQYFETIRIKGPTLMDRFRKKGLCSESSIIVDMLNQAVDGDFQDVFEKNDNGCYYPCCCCCSCFRSKKRYECDLEDDCSEETSERLS